MAVTLTQLIAKVRRRANLEQSASIVASDQIVTDAEITDYLNEGGGALHEELVLSDPNYYRTTVFREITTGNTIQMPSDFLKLRAVHRKSDSDGYYRVDPHTLLETIDFEDTYFELPEYTPKINRYWNASNTTRLRVWHELAGTTITIQPEANALGIYRILYSPQYVNLVSGSDELDYPDNWADFTVVYAALQCRIKEDIGSTQDLSRMVDMLRARIVRAAQSDRRAEGPRVAKRIRTNPTKPDPRRW